MIKERYFYMENKKNSWFRYAGGKNEIKGNIFCFPHAGSSASFFAKWKNFAENSSIYPVQYPGRENRRSEPYPESIEKLAYDFVESETEILCSQPYVLFGHCMGSLAAWETAKEMKRRNKPLPEAIIVSSSPAPSCASIKKASDMSDDEAVENLCRLGYINRSIISQKEFFDYYMSVMKTDRTLLESYDYNAQKGIKLECRIISFNGEDDTDELKNQSFEWSNFTCAGFERILFSGNHFYMNENTVSVVKQIESCF